MSGFVHAQGIKTVHSGGGGVKKWQNSVYIVVEYPLSPLNQKMICTHKVNNTP